MSSHPQAPEPLLSDILGYIERSETALAKRDMPTLAGMDVLVGELCTRVMALDIDTAKEYAPELDHLMERITQMQQKMAALQGEVASTIKSLTKTKKAASAYEKNQPEG